MVATVASHGSWEDVAAAARPSLAGGGSGAGSVGVVAGRFVDVDRFRAGLGVAATAAVLAVARWRMAEVLAPPQRAVVVDDGWFTVVWPGARTVADLDELARSLRSALGPAVAGPVGAPVRVRVAFGLGFGGGQAAIDQAVRGAVEATESGRIEVGPNEVDRGRAAALRFEHEAASAVADDQLLLHYQPVVALHRSSDVVRIGPVRAVEALVRWKHPTRALILPSTLLPVVRRLGLMPAVDRWVLDRAAMQARRWSGAGSDPVPVAVNVGPEQLIDPDLAAAVAAALTTHDLDPALLRIEVDLSGDRATVPDDRTVETACRRLAVLGVGVVADNVGHDRLLSARWPSSVAMVKTSPTLLAPVERPDRVEQGDQRPSPDRPAGGPPPGLVELLAGAVERLRDEGRTVVVHGVESVRGLSVAAEAGADLAQGFAIGRPGPPTADPADLGGRDRSLLPDGLSVR